MRPLQMEDDNHIMLIANDYDVACFLRDSFPFPYSLDHAREFITATAGSDTSHVYGIMIDGSLTGVIGLILQEDVYRYSAELGYWVGKKYWGRGIATAAVEGVTEDAFENKGIKRVFASVFAPNIASARVLEKAGFTHEGTRKKAAYKNGVFEDELLYARLGN
ncbi:MAG: GNAT family N-acetyltransferase [Bacteroidales bacterium]|nr:GNAT family N-acetyltransferase [Bacteroidales bacterium]